MKKLILIALAMTFSLTISAQDVLNELYNTAIKVVRDTTLDLDTRKAAQFRVDEVTYLRTKTLSKILEYQKTNTDSLDITIKMLNEQGYAMFQYLQLYNKRLGDCKKKYRRLVTEYFKKATIDCPLFNDDDTELTLAYYNRDDYPIQFSLDCDWQKALQLMRNIDWSKY